MKKLFALLLALLCTIGLFACAPVQEEPLPPDEETTPSAGESADVVAIEGIAGLSEGTGTLSEEESTAILSILERHGWVNDLTDCAVDVLLKLPDGSVVRYHSGCGTFVDYENQRSLSLGDSEQAAVNKILAQYVSITGPVSTEGRYDWGITLTLENLTPSGATIVCTQSGGNPTGELNTGSYYIVERLTENGWEEMEHQELEGELAWTAIAYLVNMNGTTEWEVNWEWLYGQLPSGHYRIGKEFMDFRGPGDYDEMMVYAEFSFGEMPIAE